jgi:hypothetical protein
LRIDVILANLGRYLISCYSDTIVTVILNHPVNPTWNCAVNSSAASVCSAKCCPALLWNANGPVAGPPVIAPGKRLHVQYQISLLVDGQPKTLNVPAQWVEGVREKIEMRRRFEAAAATICSVNLKRFLKEKLREKEDRPI